MLTTKNSYFSKQSNSVITQEDQLLQDIVTKESIKQVQKLLQPAEKFGEVKQKNPIRFKYVRDRPKAIFLRRTSSALMTKYSRKFSNNQTVNAIVCRPSVNSNVTPLGPRLKTFQHQANMSLPVSPKGGSDYNTSKNLTLTNIAKKESGNANHDSIFTIGETETSQIALYNKQENHSSGSRSNQQSSTVAAEKPSYQEPTHAHRKPPKEVNRKNMAKAIEAMRHAQLKQGRMNRQSVNRVCEEILSKQNIQNDKDLEQFGRRYLNKLYSIERDNTTSIQPAVNNTSQLMSQTMNSFSIGDRSGSFKPSLASYRGRVGAKGFSLQHGMSTNTSQMASQDVTKKGKKKAQPFKQLSPIAATGGQFRNNGDLTGVQGSSSRNQANQLVESGAAKGSLLTERGFEQLPEEDSLMQELLEI